jgi:hypothetical protein
MAKTLIKIGALTVDAANYETPTERTFREAWSFGGNPEAGVITVDMEKAKAIWRDKIRAARIPEFAKLDAAYMQMLEQNDADAMSAIAVVKNALRDAPADPAIDAATTPEELKAVQPAGLKVE